MHTGHIPGHVLVLQQAMPIVAALPDVGRSFGLQVSEEGDVLQMLMDSDGSHVAVTSAVVETDKYLYLGNLNGAYVSRMDKSLLH